MKANWQYALILIILMSFGCGKRERFRQRSSDALQQEYLPPQLQDQSLELTAYWEGMQGWGMDILYRSPAIKEELGDLTPAEPRRTYMEQDFQRLLPQKPVRVGETWSIPESATVRFLSQFRSSVVTEMNFDGSGAFALLEGVSDDYWLVLIRMHAQFELPEETYLSPSQFAGRMLVNLHTRQVEMFSLIVPTQYEKNIAFEATSGASGLGFVSRMEVVAEGEEHAVPAKWTERIDETLAFQNLAERFYPANAINWVPLSESLQMAKEQKKPLLVIALEGALGDQSC